MVKWNHGFSNREEVPQVDDREVLLEMCGAAKGFVRVGGDKLRG